MRIILSLNLLFLVFINCAHSQTQYPHFPDKHAIWKQSVYHNGTLDHGYQLKIEKDTFLNGYPYRMLVHYFDSLMDNPNKAHTRWFIREDTIQKKVYIFRTDFSKEYLLYDFSIQVGDTIKESWFKYSQGWKVTQIDTIYIQNNEHHVFHFDSDVASVIDGIGSLAGLTNDPWESIKLDCHLRGKDRQPYFIPDSSSNCELHHYAVGIEEKQSINSEIRLFPNPCNGTFSLQFQESIENANMTIINAIGKRVYGTTDLATGQNTFLTFNTALQPGIYFVVLQDGKKIYREKIVVND